MSAPASPFDEMTADERLVLARDGPSAAVNALARGYRWSIWPLDALAIAVARADLTLCSALQAFVLGIPEEYEEGLPAGASPFDEAVFEVLQMIQARVNAGFYRHCPGERVPDAPQLPRFVLGPERPAGSVWQLDPDRVAPALGAA